MVIIHAVTTGIDGLSANANTGLSQNKKFAVVYFTDDLLMLSQTQLRVDYSIPTSLSYLCRFINGKIHSSCFVCSQRDSGREFFA